MWTMLRKTRTIKIREKLILCLIAMHIAGIDILTDDISVNNPHAPYVILEINGALDYDIHEKPIVQGKGVDVTRLLIKSYMKRQP